LNKYIYIGFIIVFVVLCGIIYWMDYQADKVKDDLIRTIEQNSTLNRINDSLYTRIAVQTKDFDKIKKALEEELGKKNIEIAYWQSLVISAKPVHIHTADSVVVVDSDTGKVYKVFFSKENGVFSVSGVTYAPTDSVDINVKMKPIGLDIVITENKDGTHTGIVKASTSDLVLDKYEIKYNAFPKSKPFIKPRFFAGIAPLNDKMSFMIGGGVKFKFLPVGITAIAITDKGLGIGVTYP